MQDEIEDKLKHIYVVVYKDGRYEFTNDLYKMMALSDSDDWLTTALIKGTGLVGIDLVE